VTDVLESIVRTGFKRIVIVNGHGGNAPAHGAVLQWLDRHRGVQVKWHNWWNAPRTWATVNQIDALASHASWMENFPWTRVADAPMPDGRKPMMDLARFQQLDPLAKKALLGDGNFGGAYQRSDEDVLALWQVAVQETRELIRDGWS
jgi:creatinine amidohydrolase